MKLALFFMLFSLESWARPVVLMSYFDAFSQSKFNNSEKVAKELLEHVRNDPAFELKLCSLNTVFDKSFYQLEDCYKSLPVAPTLVLSLGETRCALKIEILGRNLDKTIGPDNEGNERRSTPIIPDGPEALGFLYPLKDMYCAVSEKDRKDLDVSNNAGSFVCNNLAYQFAYHYPEQTFGFMHVPSNNCRNLSKLNTKVLENLEKMIKAAVLVEKVERLKIYKDEISIERNSAENSCEKEFYKRTKGFDEKKFWSF